MLCRVRTAIWPVPAAIDRTGVAMFMCGRHLLLLHLNLEVPQPSWPIGQLSSVFLCRSVKCFWAYLIAATLLCIQFQLEHEDTKVWTLYQGHNCATFSIDRLQRCSVGIVGVKKEVPMDSQLHFTPNCGRLPFHDVLLGSSTAATIAAVPQGGIALVGPHVPCLPPHSGTRVTHAGKENVDLAATNEVLLGKPKRKYVREPKVTVESVGADGAQENSNSATVEKVGVVATSSSTKRRRKYSRKDKVAENASSLVGLSTPRACSVSPLEGQASRHGRGRGKGQGRGRIRSFTRYEQHLEDSSGEGSASVLQLPPREVTRPITRAHSSHPWRVSVLLRDLVWGGEVLPVPCPSAVGCIVGENQAADGSELLQVDFGAYLGVQSIARAVCNNLDPQSIADNVNDGVPASSIVDEVVVLEEVDNPVLAGWELSDSDSAHDWDPALSNLGSEEADFSSGDSSVNMEEDDPLTLLGEIGLYAEGPEPKRPDLDIKYSESNWHARTWSLLPRQPFSGKTPGASEHLPSHVLLQPVEYFLLFWDETLQRKVVRQSNEYADYTDPATGKRKGGDSVALPITLEEFRQFTGICCLMEVRDQPCIRDYWRRLSGALFCHDVASTMSRWRFEYILRCLHLVSRASFVTDKTSPHYDPIGKCRWILEHIQDRFQHFWNLSPYVTVDECMVQYNGRFCSFKQYLPAKPITHGIKIWAMACSVTSYVYRLEVYVGKDNTQLEFGAVAAQIGMAGQVVSRLTKDLDGQWYTVTCDNYFTSPYLFDSLLDRGFYAVGTARRQRKGYPTSMGITHEQPRGTLHIRVHKDKKMAAIYWQDTKGVYFLSTAADPMVPGGVVTNRVSGQRIAEVPTSPIQILYSQKMGGVDVGDQNRSYYSMQISTKKWWHRMYFFCLDSSIANAWTIHKETSKRLGERSLSHKEFQLCIAYSLMGRPYRSRGAQRSPPEIRRAAPLPCGNSICHVARKTNLRRVCRICKRRTFWICPQCEEVRLYIAVCFEFFHTCGTPC